MFTIPCTIKERNFPHALIDLGASINVMPAHIFNELNLKGLTKTPTIIQLADRSSVHPLGVVRDVMVKVDKLEFPTDFFVLDMHGIRDDAPILLGRPFLRTSQTKIDVASGLLTLEFKDTKLEFNVFDVYSLPVNEAEVNLLGVLDPNLPDFVEVHVTTDSEKSDNDYDDVLEVDDTPPVSGPRPTELTLQKENCALSKYVQETEITGGNIWAELKQRKKQNKKRRRKHKQRKAWMPFNLCCNCFKAQGKDPGNPESCHL